MPGRTKNKREPDCRAWHLLLTVFALGAVLQLSLGRIVIPLEPMTFGYSAVPAVAATVNREPTNDGRDGLDGLWEIERDEPIIEVLPFNLNGEVPGPLLTRILERYMPDSTAEHADELRGTLPPGHDPRMIVILPDDDARPSEIY